MTKTASETSQTKSSPHAVVTVDGPTGGTDRRGKLLVRGLNVSFERAGVAHPIVKDVSFELRHGECLAIVGESGSGKSVTARTLVGLAGRDARVRAEALQLDGVDVLEFSERTWRRVRGKRIGFILQDALVSLDPLRPVGDEIAESLRLHGWGTRRSRSQRVLDLLEQVGVPLPEVRARQRPDELSGGLRQRALIASALALDPEIIVADEPTTALDATVQAQVLDLLHETKRTGVSILLISHDLSVVADLADRILVMRGGEVVEHGTADEVLERPQHPYTRALIQAVPGLETRGTRLALVGRDPVDVPPEVPGRPRSAPSFDEAPVVEGRPVPGVPGAPAIEAVGLVKRFRRPDGTRSTAVDDVSFRLERGTTLGIVGESGSGKSTTARIALALTDPDEGTVTLLGEPWSAVTERRRRVSRRRISVVYQDPLSSFDPRWNTERILLDAIPVSDHPTAESRRARVRELLDQVGLSHDVLGRFPLRMSGGQRQRIAIARALAPSPAVIVLDEAVSALDVSVQAQVLDLLALLQRRFGLSYLFISHDLGVIAHVSDRVLVMKDGRVVEEGPVEDVFLRPRQQYTRELIASVPESLPR